MEEITIDKVVEILREAKNGENKRCTLLIGAGCSKTGGYPLAKEFPKTIKKKYLSAYNQAKEKTYEGCMKGLKPEQRRKIIGCAIDGPRKINWAHIGIAQLLKHGYVGHILTTNWDPLIVRACALVNKFPPVYDFAAFRELNSTIIRNLNIVPDEAVFHLHGQRYGFKVITTDSQSKRHSKLIKPLFNNRSLNRPWIVVGYSGEKDPLIKLLQRAKKKPEPLIWVRYKKRKPPARVTPLSEPVRNLLASVKGARCLSSDADLFFMEVTKKLGILLPYIVGDFGKYLAEKFMFLKSEVLRDISND